MDKRKQGAIDAHGVPLVQLDYYTGEYVDEYPCVQAFCDDYNIPRATVHRSFSRSAGYPFVGKIPKHKVVVIRKDKFIQMLKSIDIDSYIKE